MMQNILEIAIFQGFLFESIIWLFAQYFTREQIRNRIDEIDLCSVFIIKCVGAIGLAVWLIGFYEWYISDGSGFESYFPYNRMLGPYWFAFWFLPFLYVLVQLLWFSKLGQLKLFRFILLMVVAMVLYTEDLIIFLTSLHRDYLPSSWRDYYGNISIIHILIKCLLFPLLLTLAYIAKRKKLIKI